MSAYFFWLIGVSMLGIYPSHFKMRVLHREVTTRQWGSSRGDCFSPLEYYSGSPNGIFSGKIILRTAAGQRMFIISMPLKTQ